MSVYKRYNGKRVSSRHPDYGRATWYAWFRIGGKAYNRSLSARTEKQAKQEERAMIDKILAGESRDRGFSEFVDDVYARYINQLRSRVTQDYFIQALKAFFKDRPLSRITPQHCRDYRNHRQRLPTVNKGRRSNGSVNREMAALSKILSLAVEEGCIPSNPMRLVKRLRENDPRHRTLTDDQFHALFRELAKDQLIFDLVTLALNCPLRKAQIVAIKAADVDLDARVLWASASKGKPPRAVYLNDAAMDVLAHRIVMYPNDLFPVKRFEKRWRKVLAAAGINSAAGSRDANFHFHDLRTVLGSSMIKSGISPRVVQKVFNHSNMTTSAIYMAVDREQQREALNAAGATYPATNLIDETAQTQ